MCARRELARPRARRAAAFNLPPDYVIVGAAVALLAGTGLLMRSLGDVVGEEARLPSASSSRAKRELSRSKRFLNRRGGAGPNDDKKQ